MDADSTFLHQWNFTKEHSTRSNCGAGATMIAAYMSQKWSICGARFHMHEKVTRVNELSPGTLKGTCDAIGLFVSDPHAVMAKAVTAGGVAPDPVRDYNYDYRQCCLADPFGHHWPIEKKLGSVHSSTNKFAVCTF